MGQLKGRLFIFLNFERSFLLLITIVAMKYTSFYGIFLIILGGSRIMTKKMEENPKKGGNPKIKKGQLFHEFKSHDSF